MVTMFASPSFTPGTPKFIGIKVSIYENTIAREINTPVTATFLADERDVAEVFESLLFLIFFLFFILFFDGSFFACFFTCLFVDLLDLLIVCFYCPVNFLLRLISFLSYFFFNSDNSCLSYLFFQF